MDLGKDGPQLLNDEEALGERIQSEQSVIGSFIGSIAAGVPGFLLYAIALDSARLLAFVLPGIAVGFGAKWVGRGLDRVHMAISGIVVLVGLVLFLVFLELSPVAFVLSLPNVLIAALISKRSLSLEQEKAFRAYQRRQQTVP
ncbi:MAG: hypothetical protein AAGC71_14170 [Pseudomonadota bacterium]